MPGFLPAKHIVYQSEKEVRQALTQVSLYICFLVATTIIALSTEHVLIFYFNQAIERTFLAKERELEDGRINFKEIVTIREWWAYVDGVILDELDGNLILINDTPVAEKDKGENDKEKNEDKDESKNEYEEEEQNKMKKEGEKEEQKEVEKKEETKNKRKRKRRNEDENKILNPYYRSYDIPKEVHALLTPDNFLLGVPKLRQIRVKNNTCPVHEKFQRFFETCYAEYTFSSEDRQQYYKSTRYYSRSEYKATPVFGNLLKYDGPGYMIFLDYARSFNYPIIEELRRNDWIDVATRVVILEFAIYNSNTHLFNNIKIMAEVLPTGGVLPKWSMDVVPLFTIWSPQSLKTLIAAIVFYLLVVYYTSVEIAELLKDGFSDYFGDVQNYVDITILLTAYIALTLTMILPFQVDRFISNITHNPQTLDSLDEACFWFSSYIYVMAVCVFMVWAKIFRFVGFNKTLLQFSTTLRRCFNDILGFGAMFFVVFVAFAIFGNMVFGSSNPNFSTFQSSIFAMVRMVLGDFPYERIEKANRVLGPIFCLTYVILITFILLNMFLAIINETYSNVKLEIIDDRSALKSFVMSVFERCKHFFNRYSREPHDDPNKTESTPTSSLYRQEDTRSMNEYADVPLTSVGVKGKIIKPRMKHKFHEPEDPEDTTDELAQELDRLIERLDLIDDTVERLKTNMNRVFGSLRKWKTIVDKKVLNK